MKTQSNLAARPLIACLLFFVLAIGSLAWAAQVTEIQGRVVAVADGDTVVNAHRVGTG